MNWVVLIVGVVVIGCGLMMVAAVRLLDFQVSPTSSVPVLMRATFEGSADPFPSAAEDGFATTVDGGVYRLTSTATAASAVRTAGLASPAAAVEVSADAATGTATGIGGTTVAGVACLDDSGAYGYALLVDGAGNVTLARSEAGRLAPLTQSPRPPASTDRLQLTCGEAGTSAAATRVTGVVGGVALLEATEPGAQTYAQAGLVVIADAPGAAASFDDVLVLVPSAF